MKSQDSNGANLKAKTGNLGNNLNEPVEEEDDEDLEDGAPNQSVGGGQGFRSGEMGSGVGGGNGRNTSGAAGF